MNIKTFVTFPLEVIELWGFKLQKTGPNLHSNMEDFHRHSHIYWMYCMFPLIIFCLVFMQLHIYLYNTLCGQIEGQCRAKYLVLPCNHGNILILPGNKGNI